MKISTRWFVYAFVFCALALACVVPARAQILATASLNVERRGHTATLLGDGRVLIVGGENTSGIVNQSEILDFASQTFLIVGSSTSRTDHTATLLADGRVLIAGGRDSVSALDSTEIFNPGDNSFSAGPSLQRPRAGHTATSLSDGRILLVGGDANGSAEILDVDHQLATLTASLAEPRALHGAALLKDGRVLVAGGVDPADSAQVLDSAEIFDVQTGQFSAATTTMGIARALPTIRVLSDGKVQIIGGDAEWSMEMFNPATAGFNARAHLPPTQELLGATLMTQSRAALISTTIAGNPAVQGALSDQELAELLQRADHTITELAASALVVGGVNSQQQVLASSILVAGSDATVTTDAFDYPPGRTVTITGRGFQPGEQVSMVLHEEPETHPDTTVTSLVDSSGNFTNTDFAPASSDAGRTFTLTAIGSASFKTAQTAFSDASPSSSTVTITTITGNGSSCATSCSNPIHVAGTAVATNFQGQLSSYQIRIDWGDGTVNLTSTVNFVGDTDTGGTCIPSTGAHCANFSGTWSSSPDHTYTVGGSKTISITLYHTQPNGADSTADATATATLIIVTTPTVTTAIHNAAHTVITSAVAGSTVHDSASVSGGAGPGTGTVTFAFFNNGTCTGTPTATSGTFALTSGAADATAFAQGPLGPGSYSFNAHYNGDTNYNPTDSACEPLTLSKADPTSVTTAIHDATHTVVTSVAAGTTVHDSATVAGNFGTPTGTVTFAWFINGTCTGTPSATSGTFSLTAGAVDGTTFTQTPNVSGSFAFQATYNGDITYNSLVGPCEPLTVNKVDTTVATEIHDASHTVVTSVAAGTIVHDKATVTGSVVTPTGTVTFAWFINGTCTGTPSATSGTFALTSGAVDGTTFTQTPNVSGTFAFQATYNGDSTYNSKVGPCESLTVNKVDATVATDIHDASHATVTSVAAGTTVHDKATVTGSVVTPTGTVTFAWFINGTCTGTPAATSGTFALTSGSVDGTTFTQTPNVSGSFAFQATYSGDSTYNSKVGPCETLTVNKVDATVATDIHDASHTVVTSVAAGTTVHDKATVTGSVVTPTGTVTFAWFINGTCSGTPAATSGTFALTSGSVDATSFTQTPNVSGSFAFQATYSGDSTYNSKLGPCEVLTVGKVDATVATEIHDASHTVVTSVAAGTTVHDKATVTGGVLTPTGTVTFAWFINGTCSGTPSATSGTFALTSGAVDGTTFTQTPNVSGSFAFQATYSGDGTYNSKLGPCEVLSVGKVDATVATVIHDASHATVTSVAAGTTVHDSATVTGGVLTPTGTVTFAWFINGTCSGTPSATSGTFALTSGAVDGTTFTQTPNVSGSFAFQATYSGDSTYNGKIGPCEVLSVGKVDATVVSEIHDAAHAVVTTVAAGTTVHDKATTSGSVGTPTGTFTFNWFTNGTCSGTPAATSGALSLTSGSVDATTFGQTPSASGTFAFQASYSGDGTYNSKLGPCESLTVNKIDPTVATTIHNAAHGAIVFALSGTTVHDSVTVTGSLATPSGTVTIKWFSNGTCAGTQVATSSATGLSGGSVDATTFTQTPDFHVSTSFAFQATYNGDGVYNSKTGSCETLTIVIQQSQITTSLSGGGQSGANISVQAGFAVTDTATLANTTANAGGTVTYSVFSDASCTSKVADGGTKTVTNGVVPASNPITLTNTGVYYWRADYSGDISNNSVSSVCGDEQLTVTPHTITLAFVGGGFVPKITTPLPSGFKSPGVEVDVSFTDILHDGVRVDVTATARNVANNCAKPLTPSTDTVKVFSVPVSQGNLDTVQLAFKLFEVTSSAIKTAKKAKCESLTLEISSFNAVGVDALGIQSNVLTLLGQGPLDVVVPIPTKKKSAAQTQTLSERRAAALEEAEFQALPAGTRLPAPDRR